MMDKIKYKFINFVTASGGGGGKGGGGTQKKSGSRQKQHQVRQSKQFLTFHREPEHTDKCVCYHTVEVTQAHPDVSEPRLLMLRVFRRVPAEGKAHQDLVCFIAD